MSLLHSAFYGFAPMGDLDSLRARLLDFGRTRELKGSVLIAPEGFNAWLAGEATAVGDIENLLDGFLVRPSQKKHSECETRPYQRWLVRKKREIITMGVEGIDVAGQGGQRIVPAELKRWLDEGRDFLLVDTRNAFEAAYGTFEKAQVFKDLDKFSDFPARWSQLASSAKDKPVVMFCTGGIRCEKATAFARSLGQREVYQLEGGILKYFEDCGGAHYKGDCFVFDERVALDPELNAVPGLIDVPRKTGPED